ncbi:MAG TPA: hypothetical protein VMN39_06745, partial [Longimicrobiaceae bacterium]|nr:hypothetical protein [Longimicrobiaceae bacterium]
RVPAAVQTTKQGFVFAFDRYTGEPLWPIAERPVPQSLIPGEKTSPTQPFPTRPAPYELQGLSENDLIDFTPELKQMALEAASQLQLGPIYLPPLHRGNELGKRGAAVCPTWTGGLNINGGTASDPEAGIIYVASVKACNALLLGRGSDRDTGGPDEYGRTTADWVSGGGVGTPGPEGLPLVKPPYGRITAIDMNTGEHLWWIPNGETPDRIRNHPRLAGVELPNTGQSSHANALVTRTLLMYGEGRGARPLFHAVDKRTGETLGTIELPAPTNAGPMTFLHEGRQYIVAPIGGGAHPGSLVALRLPESP